VIGASLALLIATLPEEAAALYEQVTKNPEAAEVERAELALGSALARMNLKVAAAEYYFNVAKNRTDPKLLGDAMDALREIMAGPHDEVLLEQTLLAESELGRFSPEIDAFVSFTKGLQDLRAHHVEWAERHFAKLPHSSPLHARSLYVLGVQRLRRGLNAEAVSLLRKTLDHPAADRELRNEARIALARILFEEREYEAALDLYGRLELEELAIADATLHLERAWAHYHLGRLHEAMGILFALEAPSYAGFHAPEIFLLRAFVYKDLCQYVQSKRVVRGFTARYRETLQHIHERAELKEDPVLRAAAFQRGPLQRLAAFREMIAEETERLAELEEPLRKHLARMYALKARQIDRRIDVLLEEQAQEVAEELIDFEEQMQLLDYELGLAIHQRTRAALESTPLSGEVEVESEEEELARFEFDDEFWNDELDRYRFVLEDRCVRGGPAR
jgi:predicted negative regulator of RcsB-dependent stress response